MGLLVTLFLSLTALLVSTISSSPEVTTDDLHCLMREDPIFNPQKAHKLQKIGTWTKVIRKILLENKY